jgi:hypothetical protein
MPRRKIVFFFSAFSSQEATAPRDTTLPWLNGRKYLRLQRLRYYLRTAFNRIPIGKQLRHPLNNRGTSVPARWRLGHDFYAAPSRAFPPLKPKVDALQLFAEAASC